MLNSKSLSNGLPTLPQLLKLYQVKAKERLSQNFILSPRILQKIVESLGNDLHDNFIVEVGSGPGNLTRFILQKNARHVVGIEKDERFLPILNQLKDFCNGRFKFIHKDVLKTTDEMILQEFDLQDLLKFKKVQVIGNLPFNISTPLLFKLLGSMVEDKGILSHPNVEMALMFQKEVGDRIVARPGTNLAGRLSIYCQTVCDCSIEGVYESSCFMPRPEVDSTLVRFKKKTDYSLYKGLTGEALTNATRALFIFKRKNLGNVMKRVLLLEEAKNLLPELDFNRARAQDLTIQQFVKLAKLIDDHLPVKLDGTKDLGILDVTTPSTGFYEDLPEIPDAEN